MRESDELEIPFGTKAAVSSSGYVDVPAVIPELPSNTLAELLRLLSDSDESLVTIDPEKVVGDLRAKVDAIAVVLDRLKFVESWAKAQAKPYVDQARSCANNWSRLREYVAFAMKAEGFQELPGERYRVHLRVNPPALEMIKAEADALDYEKYSAYCKLERRYVWDTAAIKAALMAKAEAQLDDEKRKDVTEFADPALPMAKLTYGRSTTFSINPPVSLPAKKAKK
jgi:hypothetical protein